MERKDGVCMIVLVGGRAGVSGEELRVGYDRKFVGGIEGMGRGGSGVKS